MPLRNSFLTFFLGIAVTLYAAGPNNDFILHRFQLSDGALPQGSLIADAQGNLYGTTYAGGNGLCTYGKLISGCGLVFELSPVAGGGWMETILYEFQGGNDGAFPMAGLVFDGTGNLYGTTPEGGVGCSSGIDGGCGTVFELSPPQQSGGTWTESVLYRFTNGEDGSTPFASLIFDGSGNLYGTASSNAGLGGTGSVFELTPTASGGWTESTLYAFGQNQGDGVSPYGGLVQDPAGNLYGTTARGGVRNSNCMVGCGTVFQLEPPPVPGEPWTEHTLWSFQGGSDGKYPFDTPLIIRGTLVGTTFGGGPLDSGTVFQVAQTSHGIVESVLYSFQGASDGAVPAANLIADTSLNLYSTTEIGGGTGCGGIGCGTVFRLAPPTSSNGNWTESILYAFQGGNDGASPLAGVAMGGQWLAGVTTHDAGRDRDQHAGVHGDAVKEQAMIRRKFSQALILVITLAGSVFAQHTRQFNFYGGNGETPKSGLITDGQGNYYGSTYVGGAYGYGEIYRITSTANFSVLYSFNPNIHDGLDPVGNLVLDQAGNIYGVTAEGGNNACSCGLVFELSPPAIPGTPWTENILYAFDNSVGDGFMPEAGLVFDSAGNLYGTTTQGRGEGVYELSPPSQPGGTWTETVIAGIGGNPQCTLVIDSQGNLYGTTPNGGNFNLGTVFEVSPPVQQGNAWTVTILHSFTGTGDGSSPVAGLTLGHGKSVALFGVTAITRANSVAFVLFPAPQPGAWIFEVVTDISENEGSVDAPLVWGGAITLYGAGSNGKIFSISLANHNPVVTELYGFETFSIQGQLLIGNRAIYGTSTIGGNGACNDGEGCGTVWELTP